MAENQTVPAAHASSRNIASIRSRALGRIPSTLSALNSPATEDRRAALAEAAQSFAGGVVVRPQETGWVNVLARTFFSYSADNFSPARLVWEAVIRGLSIIGSADKDNLGALGEMLGAGDALGIRVTVSLETKAYAKSHCDDEINCPGESGLVKALGVGFTAVPPLDCEHGALIASLPNRASERNQAMIARLNAKLAPVTIDYQADVLPLTPAGNASIDHVVLAYINKAKTIFTELHDLAVFWADVLGRSPNDAECLLGDANTFTDLLFDKLLRMYSDAESDSRVMVYPAIADFFKAVTASGAVPCLHWRDGLSQAESNPDRLLDDAMGWGARAVSLAPDASWNLPDAEEKRRKLEALAELVRAARERNLPLLVGSPMSAPRQKFVDSFDAPEISAYFRDFTDSAFWLYGHTTLERAAGLGVMSEWARKHFRDDRAAANAFYLEVGKKARPGKSTRVRIASVGQEATPGDVLNALLPA